MIRPPWKPRCATSTKSISAPAVVVFFHGGWWAYGDKKLYKFAGQALASRGFVAVLVNYRLFPNIKSPAFLVDAAKAVAWTHRHAAEYGGDPDAIVLMGHSAGAHISAMLTLDERWLEAEGYDARKLAGMIGLAGPYDFLPPAPKDAVLKEIFGPPERYDAAEPVHFVDGDEAPIFLLYGLKDTSVYRHNIDNLARKIREAKGRVLVKLYPKLNHEKIVGALAAPLRFLAPVLDDSARFVRACTEN